MDMGSILVAMGQFIRVSGTKTNEKEKGELHTLMAIGLKVFLMKTNKKELLGSENGKLKEL